MSSTMILRAMSSTLTRRVMTNGKFMTSRSLATYYTKKHEYVKVEGGVGTVGITEFASEALGDIVYVDLPEVDDELDKGDSLGSVESVKAASDVYTPVSGKVVDVNESIVDSPEIVSKSPEEDGWFIKIEMTDADEDLKDLLDADAYKAHCESES